MGIIKSFAGIRQNPLLGAYRTAEDERPTSLLGFGRDRPNARRSLLGGDDPRTADRWNAVGSVLQGAGVGLMTGDWARGLETSQNAQEGYKRDKLINAQQARADEEWNYKKGQMAKDAEQQQQVKSLLGNIEDPQERLYAELNPEGYLGAKYAPRETKAPASVQEYQFAKQNGFNGDYPAFLQMGHPGTTINMPALGQEPPDTELRKKLSTNEADVWKNYIEGGDTAAGLSQDLQVLDELAKSAPQGPLVGRLAEMFPGVSSTGDAYQSIVTRVAPSLRKPGSGSTSDIEYEGFLKSLPRLRGSPEGNAVISGVLQAKAGLDVQRSEIVRRYLNNEISAVDARKQVADLNRRSILDPRVKQLIGAAGGGRNPADMSDDELLNALHGESE